MLLTVSDGINLFATAVTVVSTGVAIRQAWNAKSFSEVARRARDATNLMAVAERLKGAQDHIRDIAPEKLNIRGYDAGKRIDSIRREFDAALNSLPQSGAAAEARVRLGKAQDLLNDYQSSISGKPAVTKWQGLQKQVQDAISKLNNRSLDDGEIK